MGRITKAREHLRVEEIDTRMKQCIEPWRIRRWQVIRCALVNPKPAAEIALEVGLAQQTVQNLVAAYNRQGPRALETPGHGHRQRAYLLNREIDDIRATIIRQTMFAEFEKITHEMAEAGEGLTVKAFQDTYRKLLEDYFGPQFKLDDQLALECLRIPHFYRAFYVYKYATGLSAAIALSQQVLGGGKKELDDYLSFLKGGCSKDPLDLLRDAGVDMERPEPVETALSYFGKLVDELDELL